jgi:hypothetical protein
LSRSWEFFLKGWYANGKLAGTLFQSIIILDRNLLAEDRKLFSILIATSILADSYKYHEHGVIPP